MNYLKKKKKKKKKTFCWNSNQQPLAYHANALPLEL